MIPSAKRWAFATVAKEKRALPSTITITLLLRCLVIASSVGLTMGGMSNYDVYMPTGKFTKDKKDSRSLDGELREITDKVMARVTLDDIADAAGCGANTLRQARLDPSASGYRNPPAGLRGALHQVCRKRAKYFLDLAKQLKPTKE